jgi:hypothetical protein
MLILRYSDSIYPVEISSGELALYNAHIWSLRIACVLAFYSPASPQREFELPNGVSSDS